MCPADRAANRVIGNAPHFCAIQSPIVHLPDNISIIQPDAEGWHHAEKLGDVERREVAVLLPVPLAILGGRHELKIIHPNFLNEVLVISPL
jgi:hypothetical protein